MVYFIQAIGMPRGPVKIGTSLGGRPALVKRIGSLQIGNHEHLHCIAAMPGHYEEESRVHSACEFQRIRGEWFRCDGPVADYVRRYRLRRPVEGPGEEDAKCRRLLASRRGA